MIAKNPNAVVSFLFRNVLRIQIVERAAVVSILTILDSVRQNQGQMTRATLWYENCKSVDRES